jgi:hypothetical protein
VTLSEAVSDGSFTNTGWAISDTSAVAGALAAPVSEADVANDNVIYIGFTPNVTGDTDLVGQVYDVTATAVALADASGNTTANLASGGIVETDGARPVVTAVKTEDDDADGAIDTMVVTLSEAVTDADFNAANWTVSDTSSIPGLRSPLVNIVDTPDDKVLYIAIVPNATGDTDLVGEVYDTTVTGGALRDAANNFIVNLASGGITETDGAPPSIIGTETYAGSNTVTVFFSEPVYNAPGTPATPAGDLASGDITYFDVVQLTRTITSFNTVAGAASGTLVLSSVLTFVNDMNTDYVAPAAASIYDAAGNAARTAATSTLADTTNPSIVQVFEFDTDGDGNIDEVAIQFSEYMTDSTISVADAAQFTVGGVAAVSVDNVTDAAGTAASNSTDPGVPNDNFITIITDDTTATGTAVLPVTFTQAAGRFQDTAALDTPTQAVIAEVDLAAPAVVYSMMLDANQNGRVDGIEVHFSEDIQNPGVDTANWSVSTVPSGGTLDIVTRNTSSTMYLTLLEGAGARDTAVGSLQFSYNKLSGSIKDGVNNETPATGLLTPSDGAAPVMIAAQTGEAIGTRNGFVDQITMTFSEAVTTQAGDGLLDVADLASNTLTAETYVSGGGTTALVFSLTSSQNASAWDTAELPATIDYAQTGGALDIVDISAQANEAIAQTFASVTDGAAPVIVAASTAEATGTENGFVDLIRLQYSEPVSIPAGARSEFNVADLTSNTLTNETCNAGGCGSGSSMIEISVTNSENAGQYDTHQVPALVSFTTAANIVQDMSPAGNDAPSQSFGTVTDGAGPWFAGVILTDTTSGSEAYSDSLAVNATFQTVTGAPAQMQFAQDAAFTTNASAWLAYAATGTYSFTAGDGSRTIYTRLRDASNNAGIYATDAIIIDTTPPSVTVTDPNGGESVPSKAGYTYTITWSASDANMATTPISIYLDTDGSQTFPTTVATDTLNTGSYVWDTPELDTTTARIKITAYDKAGNVTQDISNADFVMDSTLPVVTVQNPGQGEVWRGGSSEDITWTVSDDHIDNPGPISIHYSTDGWISSTTVATGLARGGVVGLDTYQGTYTWNPVAAITATTTVRVVAQDDSGKLGYNIATLTIFIDSTAPDTGTISIVDNAGWTNDNTPQILVATTDNGGNSMQASDSMRYACTEAALAGAAWQAYATGTTTFNIESGPGCSAGDGVKTVWVEFKDAAGNIQSTHTSDSTNLETNATDVVTGLIACEDAGCVTQIDYPPDYSFVPSPYFSWSAPATGPSPYEGYSIGLLPRTAPSWATCTVNATTTVYQFTTASMTQAVSGTTGEMTFYVRAVDLAGNCGPAVGLNVNIDSGPPEQHQVIVENYEYFDAVPATPTYWVKPSNTFNISVRYYEPISVDKTYLAFNQDSLDNMELYHDWNNGTSIFTETTNGAVFLSPIAGLETEGSGNGSVSPTPSGTGHFKYTWTMNPLNTTTSYTVRARADDQVGNDSGWSTDQVFINIDANSPVFTLSSVSYGGATSTVTVNDQNIFTNSTTLTANGTLSDLESGALRVDVVSIEGNNSPGSLPSSWTTAASGTVSTWSYTTPAISGHNEIRFRGLDRVFNVHSSDTGAVADIDVFTDAAAPLSVSGSLNATSTTPTSINLTWSLPLDQGSGTGALNGAGESFAETQDWYRVGDVGIIAYRTNTVTSATATAYGWGTGLSLNDASLTPDTPYQYNIVTRDNNAETRGAWHNETATYTFTISTLANAVNVASITASYDPPVAQGGTNLGHILTVNVNTNGNAAPTTFEYKMKSPTTQTVTTTNPAYQFTGLTGNIQYCFTVAAINSDGIKTVESAVQCGNTINFNDTTPPTFAGVTAVSDPQVGGALDVSWNPATDDSTPITYRVFVSATSGGQNFAGTSFSTTSTTLRVTALNDGTPFVNGTRYYFVVRAVDGSPAANIDSNTVQRDGVPSVDTVPPTLDLDPAGDAIAINGTVTGVNTVTVTGVTEAGAAVSVLNQLSGSTFNTTAAGDGTFSVAVTLVSGSNSLVVTATDPGNNSAQQSATVIYDTTPPTAAISSPSAGGTVSGTVVISGSATDGNGVSSYTVEYGPGAAPAAYRTIYSGTSAVSNSTLASWDSAGRSGIYTLRLSVTDRAGNTSQVSVQVTISNTSTLAATIPAGTWTMISIPGIPLSSNPSSLLGSGSYAIRKWNPAKTVDDPILYKYDTSFSIGTGDGFWVRPFGSDISLNLTVEVESTTGSKTISLLNGWNQIGVPFNRDMLWGDVQVRNPATSQTLSMANAAANGWILGGVAYGYSNNGYIQKGAADRLQTGVGYFVKCADSTVMPSGCELLFDPGSEQINGIARVVRQPLYDMKLQVAARTENAEDNDNYIAVIAAADPEYDGLDRPEPPTIEPFVSVYFDKPQWKKFAGRYASDARAPFQGEDTWEFSVETDQAGRQVTVTFPNASELPDSFQASITDAQTGVPVRLDGEYTFTSSDTPRTFRVALRAGAVSQQRLTHTVQPGWNLITIPLDPQNTDAREHLADNFANLNIYQFFDGEMYDTEHEQKVDIQAGVGYWIYADNATEIDVTGRSIPMDYALTLPLKNGWNLIGNPYTADIPWADNIRIAWAGETYSLEQAAQQGLVDPVLYEYDDAGGYSPNSAAVMKAWKGYVIKASADCELIFASE